MERLAICAIFKNEARDLLEWIKFHRLIGFDHFILYDNGSTDGGAALVNASRFADCVTVIPWPQRPGQLAAYKDFINCHAARFDWAAFIDVDEFIHPLEAKTINELLPYYSGFSAVLINWLVFGPSGFAQRPQGATLVNYTHRLQDSDPVNGHVKTLARCTEILNVGATPHTFVLRGRCCNSGGQLVPNRPIHTHACHDRLVINHYFTKSQQDWEAKIDRGKADTPDSPEARYPFDMFLAVQDDAKLSDKRILRFYNLAYICGPRYSAESFDSHDEGSPNLREQEPQTSTILARIDELESVGLDSVWPAPRWSHGIHSAEHAGQLACVYLGTAGPPEEWHAMLRWQEHKSGQVSPEFLRDQYGRMKSFCSKRDAVIACQEILDSRFPEGLVCPRSCTA